MKKVCLFVTLALLLAMVTPCSAQSAFGTVQAGPLSGNCASSPTLGLDRTSSDLFICGDSHIWKSAQVTVSSQSAQSSLTNVTTAQALFTIPACSSTVTANCMGAGAMNVSGRVLRLSGYATFSNGATTPAITISVQVGSTTVVSTATANNANSNSSAPLYFNCVVQTVATGSSGTDEAHCEVREATAAAWASGTAVSTFLDGQTAVSSTYDHTAANAVTVNIAATAALTTVVPRHLVAEYVN